MIEKNTADILRDLAAAKAEAKEKMNELSDDALAQIAGGNVWDLGHGILPVKGDERDMNEALADVAGLMADVDGFAE